MQKKLSPEYVVGLVDGEGSFTVYIRKPESTEPRKRRVLVEPKFYIKLVEKDKEVLYRLKEFFGCGSVYFQKDTRPNHQQCYRYEVFRRDELTSIIIPFFQEHQLGFPSKRNDFETFCLLMEAINRKEYLQRTGLSKMFVLKQTMH